MGTESGAGGAPAPRGGRRRAGSRRGRPVRVGWFTHATRAFALIGVAGVASLVHALRVPIKLATDRAGAANVGAVTPAAPVAPTAPADTSAASGTATATAEPIPTPTTGAGGETVAAGIGAGAAAELAPGFIDLAAARALHEAAASGGAPVFFLDARNESDYEAAHIAGAVWMQSGRLSNGDGYEVLEAELGVQPGDTIVIYCTGGDCDASENTKLLLEDVYTNILIMKAGFDEWRAAGLPVQAGAAAPEGRAP